MIELMLEMAAYLLLMAVLGLVLGYLVWGWSTKQKIIEARRFGFRRGRETGGPDPSLSGKLAAAEQKAGLLRAETERLISDLRDARSGTPVQHRAAPVRNARIRKNPHPVETPRVGPAGKVHRIAMAAGKGVRRR